MPATTATLTARRHSRSVRGISRRTWEPTIGRTPLGTWGTVLSISSPPPHVEDGSVLRSNRRQFVPEAPCRLDERSHVAELRMDRHNHEHGPRARRLELLEEAELGTLRVALQYLGLLAVEDRLEREQLHLLRPERDRRVFVERVAPRAVGSMLEE